MGEWRRGLPAALVVAAVVVGGCTSPGGDRRALTRSTVPERVHAEVALPAPSTTLPAVPTTAAPPPTAPPTTAPPPATTRPAAPLQSVRDARVPFTVDAYRGLGTWVDVYDWSQTFGGPRGGPTVGVADIDRMADAGVQTVFIQTSKWGAPADVLEPEHLLPLIARAHARRMRVVAWYLPTLDDPAADLRRLLEASKLGVDGLAVDIEAKHVPDVAERNRRLVDLSKQLRLLLPGRAIGAIVLPPVVLDVINPNYWPGFPWRELAPSYDVWMPMAYWTLRKPESGYRDGYRYTSENITRVRQHLGLPGAPVHFIGGIADAMAAGDLEGMLRALREQGAVGGSLYDWHTTQANQLGGLRQLRWQP